MSADKLNILIDVGVEMWTEMEDDICEGWLYCDDPACKARARLGDALALLIDLRSTKIIDPVLRHANKLIKQILPFQSIT